MAGAIVGIIGGIVVTVELNRRFGSAIDRKGSETGRKLADWVVRRRR